MTKEQLKGASNVVCIKKFFDNPPVTMAEMKALTKEEREEIGKLARIELIKNAQD